MIYTSLLFSLEHEIYDQLQLAKEARAWYGMRSRLVRADLELMAVNAIIITYNIIAEMCYGTGDDDMGAGVPMGG